MAKKRSKKDYNKIGFKNKVIDLYDAPEGKKNIQSMNKDEYNAAQAASCKKRKAKGLECVNIPFSKRGDKSYAKQALAKANARARSKK